MQLTAKANWKRKRDESLSMARLTRITLTRLDGFWGYAPDDIRVAAAVSKWVELARRAHAVYMGREPIIPNFIYINNETVRTGALYATA